MTNESNDGGGKPSDRPSREGATTSGPPKRKPRRPRRRKPKKEVGENAPKQSEAPRSKRRRSGRRRSGGQRDGAPSSQESRGESKAPQADVKQDRPKQGEAAQRGAKQGGAKQGDAKQGTSSTQKQGGAPKQSEGQQSGKSRSRRRRRKPAQRGNEDPAQKDARQGAAKDEKDAPRGDGRAKRGRGGSRRGRGRGRSDRRTRDPAPSRHSGGEQDGFEELPSGPVEPKYLLETDDNIWDLRRDEPDYDWNERDRLINIVRIRFLSGGLHEEFDAGRERYERAEHVIVETDKGLQLGEVVLASRRVMRAANRLPRVIRRMTTNDKRQESRNQEQEENAFKLCQQLIRQFGLKMKLICVDYLHGGNRAIFYFSADGRVDFRQLVRDLAAQLHTRIEMRQVGIRDASRHIGGVGPCGKQLCCNSFLQRFAPVSIRMAKDQNLVLNPQKVSGVCGRLMCCLTYEQKGYESLRKSLPKPGRKVTLEDGRLGKVRDVDVLRQLVRVQLEDGSFEIVSAEMIKPARAAPPAPDRSGKGADDGRKQR